MAFESVDPATGSRIRTWDPTPPDRVGPLLGKAVRAQREWRDWSLSERAEVLRRAAELCRDRAEVAADLMASEMGKVLDEGRSEARKCGWACDHYADNAADYLAREAAPTDGSASWVQYDPLGVVLAIMPWNFPMWQALRFGAPALMAGNGFALKHAPTVQGCAEHVISVLGDAGVPDGLVVNLRVDTDAVGGVIADDRVAAVTLTGSTRAGAAVAEQCARALKKSVLELGGSDPFVVLGDADVGEAARVGAASRLLNAGQSCIAAKRFIVVRSVASEFVEQLRERMAGAVIGDPRDEDTTMGPMARQDLRDELHRQVADSVAAGARLQLGGRVPDRPGWFYPPTLLTQVGPGMPAWDEELFGPVAAVRVVDDADAAFAAANHTAYGLGASIWTRDVGDPAELARRIDAGCVFINGMVKSDPRIPFGGVKRSGWGRELGRHGILEFVNPRTVWVG